MVNAHLFRNKLRELKRDGVDLDKLPSDLKLGYIMRMTTSEALRILERRER